MKKAFKSVLSLLLCMIMVFSAVAVGGEGRGEIIGEMQAVAESEAQAEAPVISGTCGDNLTWSFDKSTGTLEISGTGYMCTWSNNVPWGDYGYAITTVIINNGVTSIGNYAFFYCDSLTNITIPSSITDIGYNAFSGCRSLTNITIPNGVTCIGDGAFSNCNGLTDIAIPDSVIGIDSYAFLGCSSLTSITIPEGVTCIDEGTFSGCSGLTNITIPDGVTSIGDHAFSGCSGLTNITIPDGVTSIGDYAFSYCSSLTSVTIGNGVTSIGEEAFRDCNSLIDITIPDSVTNIGHYAFYDCISLAKIDIPDSLTDIGNFSFDNTYFYNDESNWENGVLYIGNVLYRVKSYIGGSYTVRDGTKIIAGCSFYSFSAGIGARNLTEIIIPDSVVSIGYEAFYGCSNLATITISDSVTHIDYCAFDETAYYNNESNWENGVLYIGKVLYKAKSDLSGNYNIHEGTKSISCHAFAGRIEEAACIELKSVNIPNSVIDIGSFAFGGCISLTSIDVDPSNKFYQSENGVLFNKGKTELLQYPSAKTQTSYILPDSVISIGDHAFKNCSNLTTITIPDSVTSIGSYAFSYCYSLTNITIPDGVTSIGEGAYSRCSRLTSIALPNSIISIGNYAFEDCTALKDVYYSGTEEQWDIIHIGGFGNNTLKNATIHFQSSGNVKVSGISLDRSSISVSIGSSEQLNASVKPENAQNKTVRWESSNPTVASVSAGLVTAKSKGTAIITARTGDGGYTATCTVTVSQPVTGISLNQSSISIIKGKTYQLSASIQPSGASNRNVTWSSSNSNIATVSSSGKVSAKAAGTATITVTTKDGSKTAKCTVTVKNEPIKVTGVSLNRSQITLFVGKSENLTAAVKPSNAANKGITWQSSNTNVATVDSSGRITARAEGTATITVKTNDNGKTAKCTVTVKPYNSNIKSTGQLVLGDANRKMNVLFDANWLNTDSYSYNHNLAKFCSQISLLTYSSVKNLRNGLNNLGFKTFDNNPSAAQLKNGYSNGNAAIYWPSKSNSVYAKNSFIITRKEYVRNGEKHTVVLVALRGTTGNEWYSNFDPRGKLDKKNYTGSGHYYFEQAAQFVKNNLDSYLRRSNLTGGKNIEFIITGHSRGAAVANVLAAKLIDSSKSGSSIYPAKSKIFTYTFASPNTTKSITRVNTIYKNIFNFVNPEDFVTKVLPGAWGYGRYGVTLTLPSKTNESGYSYNIYKNKMSSEFRKYYGSNYVPYGTGEFEVFSVIFAMTSRFGGLNSFYIGGFLRSTSPIWYSLYRYFQNTICHFVSETASMFDMATAISQLALTSGDKLYMALTAFFIHEGKLARRFEYAHTAETYASYVTTMSYDQAYTYAKGRYRKGFLGTVNCPIDIEIYDNDLNEIVGRIVNNTIDESIAAGENSVALSVNGDSKSFWLPSNGNYEVRLIGNDDGEMNYTVSEISNEGVELKRINYANVTVEKGFEMCCEYSGEDFEINDLALVTELGETIEKTEILEEDLLHDIKVNVTIEGVGYATGYEAVSKGDYITLNASTDSNNSFLGWFASGELVSADANYGFVVTENTDLVAKFTNVTVEASEMSFDDSEVTLDLTGDNSAKLLNISILPQEATPMMITWESSDEQVVLVSESGVIGAVGEGTATVTASISNTDGETITASCKVHVVARKYTVKWIIDEDITELKIKEGFDIVPPESPKKVGYDFMGWSPEVPETMPAQDMTFTAVFEPIKTKISINTPSTSTVSYGFTLNLHANVTDLPEGARIVWSMDGSGFELIPSADGMTCGVKSVSKGSATITAKVVDKNGNAVKDANGNEITASQQLTSKAGFFQKLAAFFKKLFGSNMIIPYALEWIIK
jgi:uncharacterized protein YjdB